MEDTASSIAAFSLHGRTALVTGASRGIGAAIAEGLAGAGADVAVCARSGPDLAATADAISAAGRRCLAVPCDVTDQHAVAELLRRVDDELAPLDILVNNAGGPLFQAPILEVRQEGWERVFALNLHSTFHISQSCARGMVDRGRGSIINIASIPPTRAWPPIAAYSAAKAGMINLTQSMAAAFAPDGVRVNAICPGWVRTSLNAAYVDGGRADTVIDAVPMGRWAEPADLAGTTVWLASEASAYVTGAVIPVDGGLAFGQSRTWLTAMQR